MTTSDRRHVIIVTGLSGAGRSQASNVLEDLGYFVVDNIPYRLIPEVVAHSNVAEGERSRVAVVVDSRGEVTADGLDTVLKGLQGQGISTTVLFLDADDGVLANRYMENRRPHPVHGDSLEESIAREREAFEDIRGLADIIIDTSSTNVHELRELVSEAFVGEQTRRGMRVDVTSFGFKRGVPRVVDLLLDVRFLPNPHWEPDLRDLTGLDRDVKNFVLSQRDATEFLDRTKSLLDFLLPRYEAEGKKYLTIGIGCTGGKHRSVVLAEEIGKHLASVGAEVTVHHRDKPGKVIDAT